MPDSRTRLVALRTPDQHADGTWSCRYVIFEFESTRWRCNRVGPNGSFASREEAQAAAWKQAHRLIRSLKTST